MNTQVKILFEEASKLRADDREALAKLLLASLQAADTLDAAWGAEAERRWNEHLGSGAATLDALEAVDNVRQVLRRSRKR